MDEGILSLKWNNHNSTFIHTLSTLHKLEMYSDVTLACDGKYFPVHKLVLSICSEYFEEILSRTKCQHPVVVLKDIKHNDLEALLNYMYAGEANVVQSELASLIKAAECLRIKGLAVPDETPPLRDKRHSELSDTSHHSKKRRNDDSSSSNTGNQVLRDFDRPADDTRLTESLKYKRREEDPPSENETEEQSPVPVSNREGQKKIPEIVLEEESVEVKQEIAEPKIEEHDDSQQPLESNLDISYTMNMGEEENDENERHGSDSQTSHILQDLMSHSVPGPSGVQGPDTISTWESNSANLPGYSVESYSSDDNRNQQMGDVSSSSFLNGGAAGGGGGFLGSDLLLDPLSGRGSPAGGPATVAAGLHAQHQCHCCPKRFLTRQDLRRHLRTHTGERPFKCLYCSYRAALKGNVKKHILTVHRSLNAGDKTLPLPQSQVMELMDSADNLWEK